MPENDRIVDEIADYLAATSITVINQGYDDKSDVICTVNYTDNSSATFLISNKIPKGGKADAQLKQGVGIMSFSIMCNYAGHLRTVGRADAATGKPFKKCLFYWLDSGQVEETLAFGQ